MGISQRRTGGVPAIPVVIYRRGRFLLARDVGGGLTGGRRVGLADFPLSRCFASHSSLRKTVTDSGASTPMRTLLNSALTIRTSATVFPITITKSSPSERVNINIESLLAWPSTPLVTHQCYIPCEVSFWRHVSPQRNSATSYKPSLRSHNSGSCL